MTRPRLALFALGGTIAMREGGAGGLVPALDGDALAAAVPGLAAIATLKVETVARVASANLAIGDMVRLAGRIDSAVADGARGIVVTQGTDTLADSAFLLGMMLQPSVPVILTGAMRGPDQPSSDGPANLLAAATAAATPALAECGVLVVMNERLHAARFVEKRHSTSLDAFASRDGGPVSRLCEGRVLGLARPRLPPRLPRPAPGAPLPRVVLVPAVFGSDGAELDHLPPDTAGVVIAAFGAGHLSEPMADRAASLAGRMPVILASATGAGPVLECTYGYRGGERDLIARGLIPAGDLSPAKARLLLVLALAAGRTREEIASLLKS
ncbi:MAG: asparaginase [Rhodothalassiaceae bacterium]